MEVTWKADFSFVLCSDMEYNVMSARRLRGGNRK